MGHLSAMDRRQRDSGGAWIGRSHRRLPICPECVGAYVLKLGDALGCPSHHFLELFPKLKLRFHIPSWVNALAAFGIRLFGVENGVVAEVGPRSELGIKRLHCPGACAHRFWKFGWCGRRRQM